MHNLSQVSIFSLFVLSLTAVTISPLLAQNGEQLYRTYCAGCHGAQLQGQSAEPLIKETWTYGRGKNQLVRNITYGIANTEMAAWGTVLEAVEIETLADFIITAQEVPLMRIAELPAYIDTEHYRLHIEKVVDTGLDAPWALTFIGPRRALITERKGAVSLLEGGQLDPNPIANTPFPMQTRIGGLMGITADPDYDTNGWIYLALSHTTGDPRNTASPGMTRIVRGRIENHTWVDEQTLFQVADSLQVANGHRWGGQLLFDKEGYLYFTIGDLAEGEAAQDIRKAHGKTLRIHADGTIPADNPYVNEPGAIEAIFTIGNRNTQGLAQHPVTGDIWSTDHGPMGGDEVNILRKGSNYGWPLVTYGLDYNGAIVSEQTEAPGLIPPVAQWTPSIAASPASFVDSPLFPAWENNLLVGALAYEELRRLSIEGEHIINQEIILKGYGRVRYVTQGPDGAIYVILNQPDMLIRIIPE